MRQSFLTEFNACWHALNFFIFIFKFIFFNFIFNFIFLFLLSLLLCFFSQTSRGMASLVVQTVRNLSAVPNTFSFAPGMQDFSSLPVTEVVPLHWSVCVCACSVVSNSLRPHRLQSARLLSVHGILQARILEWVAMPSSRESSRPRDQTRVSCITGRLFTI